MKSAHSQKIVEISEISEKCLINEYMVSALENALSTTIFVFFYSKQDNFYISYIPYICLPWLMIYRYVYS